MRHKDLDRFGEGLRALTVEPHGSLYVSTKLSKTHWDWAAMDMDDLTKDHKSAEKKLKMAHGRVKGRVIVHPEAGEEVNYEIFLLK